MIYDDLQGFLENGLSDFGYGDDDEPMPDFSPGPASSSQLQKKSPEAMVFIQIGGGPGLHLENTYDRQTVQIRSIGRQSDYRDSEKLAQDIDNLICGIERNTEIGSALVLYMGRTGGPPSLLELDSADRYHHQCSYIADSQTRL